MIPVFEPVVTEDEIQAVADALRRGEVSGSFGESIEKFENEFAAYVGCKYGVTVNSGSSALHIAIAALELDRGSEILVSASTNIATALAAVHNGLVPIPVDSEPVTWNLDLDLIEKLITPKTRAIIPVHLYGHPVDMERLMEIANRHKLVVIEDCAESHGATVRGRMTGSFGRMSCFSFYANKVITTGEGGMITTNDQYLAEKLRLLRNLGFTTPRFKHEVAAFNFRMPGFVAALGLAQFRKIDNIVDEKRRVARLYNENLKNTSGLQLPSELDWAKNVYWMYGLVVAPEFGISRDQLTEALAERGIQTRTFFCPMNQQPVLQKQPGYQKVDCPVAEGLWANGLYLPSTWNLDQQTITFITDAVRKAPNWRG